MPGPEDMKSKVELNNDVDMVVEEKSQKRERTAPSTPVKKKIARSAHEEKLERTEMLTPQKSSPSVAKKVKNYISRLFVGEGDFSFARAYIKKHPERAPKIIATEFCSEEELAEKYPDTVIENAITISQQGAKVYSEIDATKLHEEFPEERIKRIHFNFPWHAEDQSGDNKVITSTSKLLKEFFKSAGRTQEVGDRIYMVLPEKKHFIYDVNKGGAGRAYWMGYIYDLPGAAQEGGYVLKPGKKRKFQQLTEEEKQEQRYPGYCHKETNSRGSSGNAVEAREYIFEKCDTQLKIKPAEVKILNGGWIKGGYRKYYDNVDTDPGSSEDSGDEATTAPIAGR